MHGWKGWKKPCGKIDRGHHRHIRMDRIWFYDLFWYWDSQTDNAEGKVERQIGVPHWVGSALCEWILTEKGKIVASTTVQHVTQYEAENPKIQQSIINYHMKLESVIGADGFMLDIDGMNAFINEEDPSQEKENVWDETYQGLPDSTKLDNVVDKENVEEVVSFLALRYVYWMNKGEKLWPESTSL